MMGINLVCVIWVACSIDMCGREEGETEEEEEEEAPISEVRENMGIWCEKVGSCDLKCMQREERGVAFFFFFFAHQNGRGRAKYLQTGKNVEQYRAVSAANNISSARRAKSGVKMLNIGTRYPAGASASVALLQLSWQPADGRIAGWWWSVAVLTGVWKRKAWRRPSGIARQRRLAWRVKSIRLAGYQAWRWKAGEKKKKSWESIAVSVKQCVVISAAYGLRQMHKRLAGSAAKCGVAGCAACTASYGAAYGGSPASARRALVKTRAAYRRQSRLHRLSRHTYEVWRQRNMCKANRLNIIEGVMESK